MDVPEAEPHADDQRHKLEDVDMKFRVGRFGGGVPIGKGAKSNHVETMRQKFVTMDASHEVIAGRPAAKSLIGCVLKSFGCQFHWYQVANLSLPQCVGWIVGHELGDQKKVA